MNYKKGNHIIKHILIEILKNKQGLKCGICGKSLEKEWKKYLEWKNKKIKRSEVNLDIDHKIPKSKLKGKRWDYLCNLQLSHKKCNLIKGNKNIMKKRSEGNETKIITLKTADGKTEYVAQIGDSVKDRVGRTIGLKSKKTSLNFKTESDANKWIKEAVRE